jgi:peroxin-6
LQHRKIAKESVIMRRSFQKALLPHKMRKSISAKKIFCLPWSKEDILSSLERAKKRNRAALGTPKVNILILAFRTISNSP